jgi:polyferredoxin
MALFPIRDKDRVRLLAAVASRGAPFLVLRVAVITLSNLILLAVPLLGLVRVDLWTGHHLLLGRPATAPEALRGFVIAMAALWGVTFATNIVVGRFFCGWGCPVGYTSRVGEAVDLGGPRRWRRLLAHLSGAGFVATFVAAVMLWWVDPRVLLDGSALARGVTLGIFLVLWGGGFLHAFAWRFGFCRSACPIGLYYRYVTSRTPVGIVFSNQPSPCIECGACEKICPVDIDPKRLGEELPVRGEGGAESTVYGDAECIRCGDCIEACRLVFSKRAGETPPLRFGRPSRPD